MITVVLGAVAAVVGLAAGLLAGLAIVVFGFDWRCRGLPASHPFCSGLAELPSGVSHDPRRRAL
mgnify:CR=1 FL=1